MHMYAEKNTMKGYRRYSSIPQGSTMPNKPAEPSPEVAPMQGYICGHGSFRSSCPAEHNPQEDIDHGFHPAVAPRETQTPDRSLRVMPLADKALYILMQEEDAAVRRAAVKLINIAEKHWPKEKRYGR